MEVFDFNSFRRAKIDAIGINLDDPRPAGGQPVHHVFEDFAALGGDPFSRVEIRKVPLGKAEIAIEGIEEDLEGSLQRMQRAAFERIVDQAEGVLRLDSECAEIPQHSAEHAERVILGQVVEGQHYAKGTAT